MSIGSIPSRGFTLPAKKVDNPRGGYKVIFPELFIELCQEGMWLTEIAYFLNVPEEKLIKWSTDKRKPAFMTAFRMGKTTAEAYNVLFFRNLIESKAPTQALTGVLSLLKIINPEKWDTKAKKTEDDDPDKHKTPEQKKSDLKKELRFLLNTDQIKELGVKHKDA